MKWIKMNEEEYRAFDEHQIYSIRVEDRYELWSIPRDRELKNNWTIVLEMRNEDRYYRLWKFGDREIAGKVLNGLFLFLSGMKDDVAFELKNEYKKALLLRCDNEMVED